MYVVDMVSFPIVDAIKAALKFYGYDRATMLTKRIPDLNITPEPEIRTEIKKAVVEGRSYYIFKHRLCSECSDNLYGSEDWYIQMKREQKDK